jgi:hypothetical protein
MTDEEDDDDDLEKTHWRGRLLVLALAVAALLGVIYAVHRRNEAPAPPPAPVEPPPPCIDNRCVERPGYLDCVEWANGGPAVCSKWKILYENNCVCHEWGPREPKLDGGTP